MARFGYISYSISKNLVVITVLLQRLQSDWLRHLLSICQKISSSSEYMTLRQRFSKKKLFLYFLVFRNNFDEITNTSLFLLKNQIITRAIVVAPSLKAMSHEAIFLATSGADLKYVKQVARQSENYLTQNFLGPHFRNYKLINTSVPS